MKKLPEKVGMQFATEALCDADYRTALIKAGMLQDKLDEYQSEMPTLETAFV